MALNISALSSAITNTSSLMDRFNTGSSKLMDRFNTGPRVDVSAKIRESQNIAASQTPSPVMQPISASTRSSGSGESGSIIDTTDIERRNAVTTARMNDMTDDPTLNNSMRVQMMHENLDLAVQSTARNAQQVMNLINKTG